MSNPTNSGPDFFRDNAKIVWPVLGVLGGLVLLIGGYAIWRGPHRAFLPACLSRRMRRNIMDDESVLHEKRVPSPVPIPRRAEPGRQGVRGGQVLSSADEFKREIVASRYGGQMEWVSPPPSTQQGNNPWGSETMAGVGIDARGQTAGDEGDVVSQLPRRRSSLGSTPVFSDGTLVTPSSTSIYPSAPPPAAVAPPSAQGYHARHASNATESYHPTAGRRDHRNSRAFHYGVKPAYGAQRANGHDSDVW